MIPYPLSRPFALLVLLLLAGPLPAAEYAGRVTSISDGDTLALLVPDGASYRQVKVRLGEIDTPESRQPYGERAKQTLSDLAFGKQARVVVQDTDRYGRTVGRVYVGGTDVNAEMIRQGAAWAYRQYLKDQSLLRLEAEAKAAKRGLWGLPEAHALGVATWRGGEGRARAGCKRASRFRFRWVQLRRQAVLPRNDELRRGEVLPLAVRRGFPRREQRWRAVRESVPLT
jgi:endonuclease YncB( thermonuclease family)